ncbi:MAG: gp53-like domain-containing protein [Janthinobacterium lividum]
MPTENDFLPYAVGGSANVLTQPEYAALTSLLQNGMVSGIVPSGQLNKILRQPSIMAAVLAQFIVDASGQPAIDDGTTATLLENLKSGISEFIATGFAALNGSASEVFNVAPAVSANEAVNLGQFPSTSGANGYYILPNGKIRQYGTATASNSGATTSSATVTFPLVFPTACRAVVGAPSNAANSSTGAWCSFSATSKTQSTFQVVLDTLGYATFNQPVTFNWIAEGE